MPETQDFRRLLLPPSATVRRAMEAMSGPQGGGMVLVVDARRRLLGVVVDSDLRKGMLHGHGLDAPLSAVMNPRPRVLPAELSRDEIAQVFAEESRANIPLVDKRGRVTGLARMAAYLAQAPERPNWVVLMVGGAGKRLGPLTQDRPKPLLPVGDKPILETIIEQFVASGFKRFYLAVNHHAEQIKTHFKDGRAHHAEIRYLEEKTRLGTAGPLSLLPQKPKDPLIVMNGDLLTKIDFKSLLEFHHQERLEATLCVREYEFQVPYGVVKMKGTRLEGIAEKPVHRFFVNAGIYVLDPGAAALVPKKRRFDMPQLIEKLRLRRPGSVGCFPMREYWLDIGQLQDYQKAQTEYSRYF